MMKDLAACARLRRYRLSGNGRGALWMVGSAITFTAMTVLIKYLGEDYPAALQTFYRQLAGLIVLLPMILYHPRTIFHTTRPGILLFRGLAGTVGMVLAFYSYQKLPLAYANALSFTRVLWLVPLAAVALKEKVEPHRVVATVIGFLGVLFMLQPSTRSEPGWPTAAALASSLLIAFTVTGMKIMTRDHTTITLISWSAVLGFVLAVPLALFAWRWPTPGDLILFAMMGILGTITQAFYIKGMSQGDAAVMAPLDYTRLLFALLFGYALFGDIPNMMAMIGTGIVVASTIYLTLREARFNKPETPACEENTR